MRRPNESHLAKVWRVHGIAQDFELLDVWRYPVVAPPDVPFSAFLRFMRETQAELVSGSGPAAALFKLRGALGRLFGWDDKKTERRGVAEPVAKETIRNRLGPDEAVDPEAVIEIAGDREAGFSPLYLTESETLSEITNATVHALMHLGRVPNDDGTWSPEMAVYVKPKGSLGRFYMKLIGPFRHAIVYPAMMRAAEQRWPAFLAARSWEARD